MADIPGLKRMRLLVQQPVAVGPVKFDFSNSKRHVLELTFDDGTAMNITISKGAHDDILARLALQTGVNIEQRVGVQERVIGEKPIDPGREKILPLDATSEEAVKALREVTAEPALVKREELGPWGPWKKPND